MRYLFIVLNFIICHQIKGQCVNPFIHNKDLWKGIQIELSNAEKANLLGEFEKIWKDRMEADEYYSQFFPLHINTDTLVDFIYKGQYAGEGTEVDILINTGDDFESIKKELGGILNIFRLGPNSGYIIHFLQYGCCDDPQNKIETWILAENQNNMSITTTQKVFYLDETEIPDCFDINLKFEVLNSPYTLRATPKIINEPEVIHNYDRGNIVAEFGEGDTGTALATRTDEIGRVWWFVVMDKPKHLDLFHNYGYHRNEQWSGWMSSRLVQIQSR